MGLTKGHDRTEGLDTEAGRTGFLDLEKREILFLVVLVILLFFLFNKLNFSTNRWTLHPDDHDIYYYSEILLKTGHLWAESPYNEEYGTEAFQPGIDQVEGEDPGPYRLRNEYAPGMYLVVCPGHLVGSRGPFCIVSILGIIGVVFIYFFSRELFGRGSAMLSSLFLGLCAVYVYWSNMLFSNIPAFTFFAGGLYFTARAVREKDRRVYYFLSTVFYMMSIWIRYDYIIFVAIIVLLALILYRRELVVRYVLQSLVLLFLVAACFAALNYLFTGGVMGITSARGTVQTGVNMAARSPAEWLDLHALYTNARMYIFGVAPMLATLGVLGIFLCLARCRNGFVIALVALTVVVLWFYGTSSGFWGYDLNYLASSYTRYFLPAFMCLSIFAGVFTIKLLQVIRYRKVAIALGVVLLVAYAISSVFVLHQNTIGMTFTDRYCGNRKSVNEYVSTFPENAVVVDFTSDNYYRYIIVSRTVFNPTFLNEDGMEYETITIIGSLHREGVPVYIIDNIDRTIMNIGGFEKRHPPLKLNKMEHPVLFQYGTRTPDIYMVEYPVTGTPGNNDL
ncbi:MAG: glycosyltransferase family 39 protein [Actinomycetia bacterium]|nr:glycosyltransferase family 39 protein [Actinomycetes bacterium]